MYLFHTYCVTDTTLVPVDKNDRDLSHCTYILQENTGKNKHKQKQKKYLACSGRKEHVSMVGAQ